MKRRLTSLLIIFSMVFCSFAITPLAEESNFTITVSEIGLDDENHAYADLTVEGLTQTTYDGIVFQFVVNGETLQASKLEAKSRTDDNPIFLAQADGNGTAYRVVFKKDSGVPNIRVSTNGSTTFTSVESIQLLRGNFNNKGDAYHINLTGTPNENDNQVQIVYAYLNQEEPSTSTSSYTASFQNPSANSVAPGETFTVPITITSSESLAAAELNLKATNATIEDVKCELTGNGIIPVFTKDTGKFTFTGNEESAENGLKVATVTLKAGTEGKATLAITDGKAAKSMDTGVSDDGIISDGIEITVPEGELSVTVALPFTVTVKDYVSGVTLVKCTTDSDIGSNVPQYDNHPMFKREYTKDNSTVVEYLYLVKGTVDEAAAKGKVSLDTAAGVSLKDSVRGDLNGSGVVSIVDAQIAYDIAKGNYPDIADQMSATSVDMLHWLMADVNYLDDADALDARAIQVYLHTGDWDKQIEAA